MQKYVLGHGSLIPSFPQHQNTKTMRVCGSLSLIMALKISSRGTNFIQVAANTSDTGAIEWKVCMIGAHIGSKPAE